MSHLDKDARRSAGLLVVLPIAALLLVPMALHALDGSAPPGSNFNLSYWELAIPTGPSGNPTIISNSSLENGYTNGSYFFTNSSDGAMVMKQPGSNCTKFSGSSYCRTEFHEVDPNSGNETSWSPSGTNKLNATLKVTTVGSGVVVSQVFLDDSAHKPLGELEYKSNGDLCLNVEKTEAGGAGETPYCVGSAPVGSWFSYELSYTGNKLSMTFDGGTRQYIPVPSALQGINAFFKAGDYGQSSSATDVHFTNLTISH
jgi:Alginate lyase